MPFIVSATPRPIPTRGYCLTWEAAYVVRLHVAVKMSNSDLEPNISRYQLCHLEYYIARHRDVRHHFLLYNSKNVADGATVTVQVRY